MNTPIGTAATAAAAQQAAAELRSPNPEARDRQQSQRGRHHRHLRPHPELDRLAAWQARWRGEGGDRGRPNAHQDAKTAKVTTDKRLIWSGQATAKPGDSKVTLQVPKGRLRDSENVRWRARLITGSQPGPWANWESLQVSVASSTASEPAPAREFATTATLEPPPAVNEHPRMKPTDCEAHRGEAKKASGWAMSRYSWCSIGEIDLTEATRRGTTTHFAMEVMTIAYTFSGTGSIEMYPDATSRDIFIDNYVKVTDDASPSVLMGKFKLGVMPTDVQCIHVVEWDGKNHENNVVKRLGGWATGDSSRGYIECPPEKASPTRVVTWNESTQHEETIANTEKVTLGRFKVYGRSKICRLPCRGSLPTWVTPETSIRRHGLSATTPSISTMKQVAVYSAPWFLRWSTNSGGKDYDEAYKHFWTACYAPNDTYPPLFQPAGASYPAVKDKSIPGCLDPNKNIKYNLLHRIPTKEGNNNRSTMTTPACNHLWGAGTTGGSSGMECDEFPFAKTWERWNPKYPGAIVTSAGYSLCPIPSGDNGKAGALLSKFYGHERILVGDPYFVRFKTKLTESGKCKAPLPGRNW